MRYYKLVFIAASGLVFFFLSCSSNQSPPVYPDNSGDLVATDSDSGDHGGLPVSDHDNDVEKSESQEDATIPSDADEPTDKDFADDTDLIDEDIASDSENTGNTGNDSDIGNTGNSGNTADSGDDGNTGDTGDTGDNGDTDDPGNTGNTGNPTCTPGVKYLCYTGHPATRNKGICKDGKAECLEDGASYGECVGEVLPNPLGEICDNDLDDNCNGVENEGCICVAGSMAECYDGPAGTKGIGICKPGLKECTADGKSYGECVGQTLPSVEICNSGFDEDCDGNELVSGGPGDVDLDKDGYSICDGDCCDSKDQCADPNLVNPGAVEFIGDGIDNNCNGVVDEPKTGCSTEKQMGVAVTAIDLLKAMDICEIHDPVKNNWGIVGTPTLTRASGSGAVDYRQYGVTTQFGTDESNKPIFGDTIAVLSSGRARDANDTPDSTSYDSYEYEFGTPPPDFIAEHGGKLPVTKPGCPSGTGANDSVMLKVQIKVPTNAHSFSFDFRFFSQEYLKWTCKDFNDFFITMLDTEWTPPVPWEQPIPSDKNISFDSSGNYISVNSDQFFTVCKSKTGYPCPDGTAALEGTGYQEEYACGGAGGCDGAGATRWLTTTAPVVPGEVITLRFIIWDTSDRWYDSLVLIDNFRWHAEGSAGPVTFACWDLNKNGICDLETEDKNKDGFCDERDCKQ
ncbi:MAG: choice-of-anchor L domain-containing protein [bacterium]